MKSDLKACGLLPDSCELRQVKYLNNLVEQDHRFLKRRLKPGLGFFSFETAWSTLQGYEVMYMIRKGQMRGVEKGDITGQAAFIARLFGVAAKLSKEVGLHAQRVPPDFLQHNLEPLGTCCPDLRRIFFDHSG